MDVIDVILRRKDRPGSRGYQYEVTLCVADMPETLLATSRDPEYATCRRLLEMGYAGTVRFWRIGKTSHDSSMDIERGAKYSTSEISKGGIRIAKYNDFWHKNQEDNEEFESAA